MKYRLNVADLNAIETRVAAWVAGCQPLLDVFTTYICVDHPEATMRIFGQKCCVCGKSLKQMDPYLSFACKMYNVDYFTLARDYGSKDPALKGPAKEKRQIAKPGVLGAVYRLSGGDMGIHPKTKEPMKTGLWGYAENMGVEMSQEKANETVKVFRQVYEEIVYSWYALDRLPVSVMTGKPIRFDAETEYGQKLMFALKRLEELRIYMDKFTVSNNGIDLDIFRIHLPSGRRLHYYGAFVDDIKMPWKKDGEDVFKTALCYEGVDQETKQWMGGITTHGGKIFENIVQAVARDVLVESMLKFENNLYLPIIGHVHDEAINENPDDSSYPGVKVMEDTMRQPISWAPGLPLGADGFEDYYYHK